MYDATGTSGAEAWTKYAMWNQMSEDAILHERLSQALKVIHTVPRISEEASGPSYSVVRLCESLIAEAQEVVLATLDAPSKVPSPSFQVKFPLGPGPERLGRSPKMNRWLDEQARQSRVDVFHNHGLWMMPNVYPGWAARKHQIPLVVSPRGTFTEYAMASGSVVKRLFWPLVQKPALSRVSCFHATCEAEYRDIRRLGFTQPVAIIPNGVDEMPYVPTVKTNFRTVLYLGRVHPEKGMETLLRAWQHLEPRHADWRLQIVGPGKPQYVSKMQVLAKTLKLQRVEFTGPRYGADKWNIYRAAELYVLPSPSENFAVSVAEALMAGTPVIATKGAPWEKLEAKQAGWWIDIGEAPLQQAMEHALRLAPHELGKTGLRGRDWMLHDFGWSQIGRDMTKLYHWLLFGGKPPIFVITD